MQADEKSISIETGGGGGESYCKFTLNTQV